MSIENYHLSQDPEKAERALNRLQTDLFIVRSRLSTEKQQSNFYKRERLMLGAALGGLIIGEFIRWIFY